MKLVRACGFLGAIACAALLAVVPAASAWQTAATYKMVVSPATVAGGAPANFTVALTNTSSGDVHLESANVAAPPGFTVTAAALPAGSGGTATVTDNVAAVRDVWIGPGSTLNVSVTATAPCAAGSYTWSSAAKRDADFDGASLTLQRDASVLTTQIASACSLKFTTEPQDAVVDQSIAGEPFDPSGPPVAVAMLDGNGAPLKSFNAPVTIALGANPGGATLSGTTTEDAVDGVATFGGLTLNEPADGYTLSASAPNASATTSTPFNEVNAATVCSAGQTCQASASTAVSSLTVSQPGVQNATLSVSVDVGTQLQCTGYKAQDPNWFSFVSSTTAVGKQVVYRLTPSRPSYEIGRPVQFCFGAPYEFTTRSGRPAPQITLPDGTTGFVGLLPKCSPHDAGPCISSQTRQHDRDDGTSSAIVVTVLIPAGKPGDPWGRV